MAVEHGETIVAGSVNDGGFTITGALALLRRHTRLATVVFAAVLASAATFAMSLPDMYRSTATVLVEHPRDRGGSREVADRRRARAPVADDQSGSP